jgi:hypothetical protein
MKSINLFITNQNRDKSIQFKGLISPCFGRMFLKNL